MKYLRPHPTRWVGAAAVFAGAVLVAPGAPAGTPKALPSHTYLGPAVHVGDGSARVVVTTDAAGRPSAVGLVFTTGMLTGLPAKPGKDPALDHYYIARFPARAPFTGFDHVLIDWHPLGHMPKNIYTVPHFDFHFYLIGRKAQMAITYPHPETTNMTGVTMPATALVPAGYFIPPGTQVNEMGLHAVPGAAPEFNGKPFTNTFIYGYFGGKLIFLEPMITIAYLQGHPNHDEALPAPATYSFPGYYPTRYQVQYDAQNKRYSVLMTGLKRWPAGGAVHAADH